MIEQHVVSLLVVEASLVETGGPPLAVGFHEDHRLIEADDNSTMRTLPLQVNRTLALGVIGAMRALHGSGCVILHIALGCV